MPRGGVGLDASNFATVWTVNNPPYVILKWSIENFSYAQSLIESPCFDISQTSKWHLLMDPSVAVGEDTFVVFYLRMDPRCSQPAKLMMRGEFSVHGPLNELIFDKLFEQVCDSSVDSSITFHVPKTCFSLKMDTLDTYLARCEIIISREKEPPDERWLHLEKLSRDFQRLYEENKTTDVTIRVSRNIIGVHKAILCARSNSMAEMLGTSGNSISESGKSSLLEAVLLFVYSGNPDLILNSIPVEEFGNVASIASRLKMDELGNILTPVKMHCKTCIRNKKIFYSWLLKNFSKLPFDARGSIRSAEFVSSEDTKTKWNLVLEKSAGTQSGTYGLYLVKLHPDSVTHKVEVEFSMCNRKSKHKVTKWGEYTFGPRNVQKFGFPNFTNKDYLQSKILKDDVLMINCTLKFRLESESWIHSQEKFIDVSDDDSNAMKYIEHLSRSLKELYVSGKWSDITLFSGDGEVRAHGAVLWARSPYFCENLSRSSAKYISVPIGLNTLREVLLYMYSAELPSLNCQNSLRLYRACSLLRLTELWHVCRLFILRNLNVDIVLEVIALAHENSDLELKHESMAFVCVPGNAKMILNKESWRIFRETYIDLAILIYHKLAWDYCNHICMR